jgi:hypothetical protein
VSDVQLQGQISQLTSPASSLFGTLNWHYNNTLNQLTKADKSNITEYYVYDYQGNRVVSKLPLASKLLADR